MFLLVLCNDREVLGPWVNKRWLNVVAVFIVSVLLLSGILMATTLFPDLNVVTVAASLTAAIVVLGRCRRRGPQVVLAPTPTRPETLPGDGHRGTGEKCSGGCRRWALLEPVTCSAGRKLAMLALRGYLVVGAIVLLVKAIQLGGGGGA